MLRFMSSSTRLVLLAGLSTCALAFVALAAPACSSSTSDTPTSGTTAAVAGPASTHCSGKPVVVVSQAACHVDADAGHSHDTDAGDTDAGAEPAPDYGPTQYGSEGEDDDCKYHVKWQSTAVAIGSDVTFTVVATTRSDNAPLAGATPYAEVFLDETHPAPNTPVKTVETSPGTYTIGPVRFDKAGNWNVRFHFHDECTDSEESPHGHVAFFVKVL
jgi:hypothetical protein